MTISITSYFRHEDGIPYIEPVLTTRRIVIRLVFVCSMIMIAKFFFHPQNELVVLAPVDDHIDHKFVEFECSKDYQAELVSFTGMPHLIFNTSLYPCNLKLPSYNSKSGVFE